MTELHRAHVASPVGALEVVCTDQGIRSIAFVEGPIVFEDDHHPHLLACMTQLSEYFEGNRKAFHSLTLRYASTDVQRDVWEALMGVPFGETVTYAELAKAAGHPGAARAVGTAMRLNPLVIIVPCHRVVPEGGGIGEYARGVNRKEWLLNHEKNTRR
ncbi:methylated-DNA--[protein]-cysteine S-methyltransferase [Candidatus Peregrinibacteria bacterium]|nr:methylated-DNA--[protein]-cysteine S-methyltransferase [Candidatus Peregrinibacteria bacterium]